MSRIHLPNFLVLLLGSKCFYKESVSKKLEAIIKQQLRNF